MTDRVSAAGLQVARPLHDLVATEIAPGTGIDPDAFWKELAAIVADMAPKNRELLERRDALQATLDEWHEARRGNPVDLDEYKRFLHECGYLLDEGPAFAASTENVDPEIAKVAGPQLVVPVDNARYALNAANARWGSLYDALYGTDVIPDTDGREAGSSYNPKRGARVIGEMSPRIDTIPGGSRLMEYESKVSVLLRERHTGV